MTTTDECIQCGLVFENSHATCQGHQWCYPECPRCGGDLQGDPQATPAPKVVQR